MLSRLSPVALAVLGTALLCVMDAVIKSLTVANGTLAIAFGRYLFGGVVAAAIWHAAGRPAITAEMLRAHAVRGVLLALSAGSFFFALSALELAEAITLGFVAPLLVPFAAWLMVGERPRATSVLACAAAFAGVFVATRGASGAVESARHAWGVAAALLAAVTYALSIAMLRSRADRDGAPSVGLLQSVIPGLYVGIAALIAALPVWQDTAAIAHAARFRLADWPSYAVMGLLGASGWYLLINAYARAEAQRLAPIEFTALLWATGFGWILFAEAPRPQVFAGAILIIGACAFAAWEERRGRVTPAPQIVN